MNEDSLEMPDELITVRDFMRWAVSRFTEFGLFFGHGTQDAYDEAAYLILHTLYLPRDRLEPFLDAALAAAERAAVFTAIERRVRERVPAAYLTHEAWLGNFRFYVDERVIVPRSHIAGLLFEEALAPWLNADSVGDALDLCTGSGCLAIVMAHAFPHARVDAVDLSPAALEVARRNVEDYTLGERVRLVQSDLFAQVEGRNYDIIISNPPYVTSAAMQSLPPETRAEPELALAAGEDGLDTVRRLLAQGRTYLKPDGIIVIEVGDGRAAVERAFPKLEPVWFAERNDAEAVFLLTRDALPDSDGN